MRRVIDFSMRPKLSLDVLISQNPHFMREMLSVSAEQSSVEMDRGEESHWVWSETALGGGCGHSDG